MQLINISKEVKVGLLTVVSSFMLYFGFNFLKGIDIFTTTNTYHAIYDATTGLQVSNSVTLNGVPVGLVKKVGLLPKQGNKILVTFEVDEEVMLGSETEVVLQDASLLGGKELKLLLNGGRIANDGDTLKSSIDNGLIGVVEGKAGPMMDKFDTLLSSVTRMVVEFEKSEKSIERILEKVELTVDAAKGVVNENRGNLSVTMQNVKDLTTSLKETEKKLSPLLDKFDKLADNMKDTDLKGTVAEAKKSMQSLNTTLAAINDQKGTVGKLMHDDSLYVSMDKTLKDLDALFIDLKEHPKRYVHFSLFGRKDKSEKKKKK